MSIVDFLIYPIYLLILGFVVFVLSIYLYVNYKNNKNLTNLILSCINLTTISVFFSIYKIIIKSEIGKIFYLFFQSVSIVFILYFIIFYISYLAFSILRNNLFVKSISNSPWNSYIILNKNDKVKKISDNLLSELGVKDPSDVLGKRLFNFLFQKIRITSLNQVACENKKFYDDYINYKSHSAKGDINTFEIGYYNSFGNEVFFRLSDQPIFHGRRYLGRIIIGQIKTGFDMLNIEKKYESISNDFNILNEKFISVLEVCKEGLAFFDLNDKTIWLNDNLKDKLNFSDNLVSVNNFYKLMNSDDLNYYNKVLNTLTPENPTFKVKYRLFSNGTYLWYQEVGKKIFTKDNIMITSSISPINQKHIIQSNINELDNLKDENEMLIKLDKLINEQVYFHLVYIKIKNIKEINEMHKRSVGNMILAQYVKKINDAFITGDSELFRLSGTRFGLILTDSKKMGILKDGLSRSESYLNLVANYGAVQVEADVYCGIAVSKIDSNNAEELAKMAHTALKFSLNPRYKAHICYYSDIK